MHLFNVTGLGRAALVCFLACVLAVMSAFAQESKLGILEGGVQSAEDGPFVSASYKFLPGETLYLTFDVGGYKARKADGGQAPRLALDYSVSAMDPKDVLLAPPVKGTVEEELNPEDKDWTPKRRVSLQLPPYMVAGTYHALVQVLDKVSSEQTSRNFPFQVGGVSLLPSSGLSVQRLQFFRTERDREPLELAAYRAGDPIIVRFLMAGFKSDVENRYKLSYEVTVLRPDGKPYLRDASDAKVDNQSFYPAPYVPADMQLSTSANSEKGQYVLIISVHDQVAQATQQFKSSFSLE